ncbi:hypothetical protein NA78x_004898 [Anatilimnocola sp. NA78]|uniref:hypothetical protein n=1 Tax=Anatilimnocola sp. NA78 TaxID=3415683 RepID=UPI003CE49817
MHAIRLKAPWQIEKIEGGVCYIRRFGLPTNLGADEQVSLVVERVAAPATIELNDQLLGEQLPAEGPKAFEITRLLQPRSEIRISFQLTPAQLAEVGESHQPGLETAPGTLLGEVRLEIA